MARPKADRPRPIEWPEIASGQSERLRALRERREWSLRDLAAASGVSVEVDQGRSRMAGEERSGRTYWPRWRMR